MKKIIACLFIASMIGCSTVGHNRSGYVVTKDGTKHEFSDSMTWFYQDDFNVIGKHRNYYFPDVNDNVREIYIKIPEKK